jgi:hypothetical protein
MGLIYYTQQATAQVSPDSGEHCDIQRQIANWLHLQQERAT